MNHHDLPPAPQHAADGGVVGPGVQPVQPAPLPLAQVHQEGPGGVRGEHVGVVHLQGTLERQARRQVRAGLELV